MKYLFVFAMAVVTISARLHHHHHHHTHHRPHPEHADLQPLEEIGRVCQEHGEKLCPDMEDSSLIEKFACATLHETELMGSDCLETINQYYPALFRCAPEIVESCLPSGDRGLCPRCLHNSLPLFSEKCRTAIGDQWMSTVAAKDYPPGTPMDSDIWAMFVAPPPASERHWKGYRCAFLKGMTAGAVIVLLLVVMKCLLRRMCRSRDRGCCRRNRPAAPAAPAAPNAVAPSQDSSNADYHYLPYTGEGSIPTAVPLSSPAIQSTGSLPVATYVPVAIPQPSAN